MQHFWLELFELRISLGPREVVAQGITRRVLGASTLSRDLRDELKRAVEAFEGVYERQWLVGRSFVRGDALGGPGPPADRCGWRVCRLMRESPAPRPSETSRHATPPLFRRP